MINKAAFKQLFDNYFDTIRSFIFYRCGDTDTASDMAQDIFMKVWEKRENLDSFSIKPLLYKMANDMVISNYRKSSTRMDYEKSLTIQNESPLSPEEELNVEELASSYAKALEKMPETQRVVFLMNRNDELKYHEISECLDISIKTVEKRMSAALQFLRAKLL
ncbi:RNA polymerase sigma-70 factor (family 1) [Parabacteroides sp. PF5-5]|uniref:RNA polymerase sigma factor n=1 Tax=unclassified Parabacteroides TaxID=2649774 RepID=UPI0024752D40|nr:MULTISPECIES: RNA polymerase sigma-70 factor [unclassified Parabacteroides]MDH6304151.1 RNA polymerase sigma-70 factor (family 1) [Parabacteroides sp. PH5-39]MDH6315149.1 RNA polymerase sigma-70 factor (family 1) [Parabacteroides sp. PF5-13]MDH6318794.1 RNA polymerase sigma-70 factor (family 1) [Parabacteroides sp. PH5-13]MDH6322523.1 RNA polymerase sigma-70 factor (family 1) [Parabacteroides sp. PH5-8]MDH6326325.1 RNA polymerase sigma-70 factor (family 1) [Parabacteroides sp. PH5-41]